MGPHPRPAPEGRQTDRQTGGQTDRQTERQEGGGRKREEGGGGEKRIVGDQVEWPVGGWQGYGCGAPVGTWCRRRVEAAGAARCAPALRPGGCSGNAFDKGVTF